MKKKRVRLIAVILTGILLTAIIVPTALAQSANSAGEGERTETTLPENGRQRGGRENGTTENGTGESAGRGGSNGRGSHARPEEPEEPENAIGKDAAKELALTDAGLTAEQVEKLRARLSDKDGTLVYKVSFRYDGQRYSYKIDAVSGTILDSSVGEASEHSHGSHARPEEPEEPENAIGKDAAKEIALTDAGLTAEQVEKLRARLSDKDGTPVYKVSFRYDGQRYSYKIDAVSGVILDKTVEEASAHTGHGHAHVDSAEDTGTCVADGI